jgi:uncharacterized OsmC-like protein
VNIILLDNTHYTEYVGHGRVTFSVAGAIHERRKMMNAQNQAGHVNGINLGVLQETVSAIKDDPELGKCRFRARNKWSGGAHNCTTISDFDGAKQRMQHKQLFELHCDEPSILAGQDDGANPVEHLLNALAGCVTTSMVAHAAVLGIRIDELESELEGDIDLNGFLGLDSNVPKGFTEIRVNFKVKTEPENLEKLRQLATFSPVYNTLIHSPTVNINIESK